MSCKTNKLPINMSSLVIQLLIRRDTRPIAVGRVICHYNIDKCNKDIILERKNVNII